MKSKLTIIFLLIGVFFFSACENLLDVDQRGTTAVDEFYKTDTDAEEGIAAVYVNLRSMYFNWFWMSCNLSDDVYAGGGGRGDNAYIEGLNEYTFTPANTIVQGVFTSLYSIIYKCNMIIDHVEGLTPVQKRVVAEAKTARAFCYFYLVNFWGTPPFVLHELLPSEYKQPNGKPSEIWAQIEKDLNEAINSTAMLEKSAPDDKTVGGHLSRQLAQTMLGKAYLWQKKYAEAATQFDAVINSGKYSLITEFENICRAGQDLGAERIFEAVATNDPANSTTQGIIIFNNIFGWRTDHMNIVGFFAGMHDIHFLGWGFNSPTKTVYDAFVEMEGVDGYRLNSTMLRYDQVLGISKVPGFELTVGGVGLYGHEGYFPWKHRILGSEVVKGAAPIYWHSNLQYVRYGEVLLLGAEASLMAGNAGKALNYINQIRQRAKLSTLASVTINDVKKEKRLELWAEGTRYLDLQRWGDAATAMPNKGAKIPTFYGFNPDGSNNVKYLHTNPSGSFGYKTGKHELLPFPEHEVMVNPNIVQNPGW